MNGATLLLRFNRLSRREQGLLLLVGMALIWAVVEALLLRPTQLQMAQAQQLQIDAEASSLQATGLLDTLKAAQFVDPDAELKQRLAGLRVEQQKLSERIGLLQANLILPEQMIDTLQAVLQSGSGLTLSRLTNLPVEVVSLGDATDAERPEENLVMLYRHGLEIEVSGSYLALLAYLQALEQLPWRLYWQALELDATEYPESHLRLQLQSYSLDGSWIGV